MAKTDRGDSNTAQIGRAHRVRPASGLRAALLLALAMLALAAPSALGAKVASPFGAVYEHLSYGPRLAQQVNVFDSGTPNSPIVVLVHGGGWRIQYTLSRFASESMALQQQGFTVFDINYRQDSERRPAFPIEPEDVMLATRWAIDNAASFHGDPRSVFLLGGSAGGQLAGIAAEQMNAATPGTVDGVISLSAPMNLAAMVSLIDAGKFTGDEFIFSLEQALGRLPGTNLFSSRAEMESFPAAWSPALHVSAQGCAKWLLFHSEAESIPLSQAQEMAGAAGNAGCGAKLQVLPGAKHAFAYFNQVVGPIASFIRGN